MTEPALEVTSLCKAFPGKPPVQAVRDVSFSLARGEILGILGPNGAGKTTVIRILISLLKPSSGVAKIMGHDLATERSRALSCIGYASTYTNLPLFLTVEQNLDIHGRFYGMSGKERRERSGALLDRFGVEKLKHRRISQLSSGQRTRMMLIKSLLSTPQVLLLDEPTASLDVEIAEEVRKYIRDERRSRDLSVLFTSHNMEEITNLCDRVIFLSQGSIIAEDTPRHLARGAASTQVHISAKAGSEMIENIAREKGLDVSKDDGGYRILCPEQQIPALITDIVRAGVELVELRIDHPTLRDFFMTIVR